MTVEQLLATARARLDRLAPQQALAEQRAGAVVVDIRPAWQRADDGEIAGSLVIERNHLEWRLDPTSGARLPEASHDFRVVVVCQAGYTSSLAAAALLDLGIHRATDLACGVDAWRQAGLPLRTGPTPLRADPVRGRVPAQ